MASPSKKEPEPSDEEKGLVQALLYDTLLGQNPLVSANVRAALQVLLVKIGRPKLAAQVEKL